VNVRRSRSRRLSRVAVAIAAIQTMPGAPAGGLFGAAPACARPAPVVEVTVVADERCAPGLRDVVTEQLAPLARDVTWTCVRRLDEDALFRATARAPDAVGIWIDVSLTTEVRLLVRDQAAGRFVVRRLALAQGLDPVAREEVAPIVRAAALALVSGPDETLTRAQARAAVSAWPPPPDLPPTVSTHPPPRAPPPGGGVPPGPASAPPGTDAAVDRPSDRPPMALDLGALITGRAFSRSIPALGELGAFLQLSRGSWGAWAEGTYQLPASYRADPAGVDLASYAGRMGVTLSTRVARLLTVGGGAGFGAARISFRPSAGMGPVDLAAPSTFVAFSGRVLARAELDLGSRFRLGLALFGDVATARVHYDLSEPAGARRVVSAFLVQPGLELRLGWRL